MTYSRLGRLLVVLAVLLVGFGVMNSTAGARNAQPTSASLKDLPLPQHLTPGAGPAVGVILENFANTWHVSTLGFTYDPISDSVWYAHEGFESDPVTIWHRDRPAPHSGLGSYNLSALNAGFPSSLNNRDGAAYDPATQTFFLPDYQGDLAVRDDNIVEINRAGTILNAWEIDGKGNDSSDESLIDTIIDMAIVPGTPNRYFAAAAEGTGVIYEIALTRAGLFVENSWSTVGTCTVAGAGDVIGIDYDASLNQLVVSSFSNEVVSYVNLDCTVASQLLCDGPGTVHTGITVIPGTNPREVWLTDFTSNSTSRCAPEAGGEPEIDVNPGTFEDTHNNPPQTTTDTLTISNTGTSTLTWTLAEDDSRPFANPNPVQARDANALTQRLGAAGGAVTSLVVLGPIVGDGSFETGTPNASWEEFSSNFGTPLCDAVCGTGGGTGPRTGAWWSWFGGTTAAETGIITQSVTIPNGSAELSFWLEIPATATGTNGFLSVQMDGTEVFRAEETTTGYATYAEVAVDVSAYADGGAHDLVFFSTTDAGAAVTNFFVDDVAITSQAGGACTAPTDIPWLGLSATAGTTGAGGSSNVTLTYNSASLAQGTYTGTLCLESDDADEPLITLPVTLNVGLPTAVSLSSFTSPMTGVNPAYIAAAGLLMLAGAVLVLRRK